MPTSGKYAQYAAASCRHQKLTPVPSAALKTHPDRVPADSPERAERTRKFQLVNDAYFTLSDDTRRREYDSQRKFYGGGTSSSSSSGPAGGDPFAEFTTGDNATGGAQPGAAQSAFSWAWNFFQNSRQGQQGQAGAAGAGRAGPQTPQQAGEEQFGDVFEEMLREEGLAEGDGTANNKFWGMLGGASGAGLGFIVANVPGLLAGAVAGNRLGAIRDAKGKSVYSVFQVSGPIYPLSFWACSRWPQLGSRVHLQDLLVLLGSGIVGSS